MRLAVFCSCASLISMLSFAALAQSGSMSPADRRDQIAKVQEMLADPDPMMRLANMESIVNSGDLLKLQVALRTALSSDDAALRGLAMRAYLATRKEITFDIVLPAPIQKQVDAAQFDQTALQELSRKYDFLRFVLAQSSRFHLTFDDYSFNQDVGTLESARKASFSITGDKLSTLVPLIGLGTCYVDFKPTRNLTFEGTMACGPWPKLAISAPIF